MNAYKKKGPQAGFVPRAHGLCCCGQFAVQGFHMGCSCNMQARLHRRTGKRGTHEFPHAEGLSRRHRGTAPVGSNVGVPVGTFRRHCSSSRQQRLLEYGAGLACSVRAEPCRSARGHLFYSTVGTLPLPSNTPSRWGIINGPCR